jgi:uncharacterized protein Ymh
MGARGTTPHVAEDIDPQTNRKQDDEPDLLAAAEDLWRSFRSLMDRMNMGGDWGPDDYVDLKTKHFRLARVFTAIYDAYPIVDTSYPVRVWTSRLGEQASQALAFLRANPAWKPPRQEPPASNGWVHRRLWHHIEQQVQIAEKMGLPGEWAKVAREATIFLEGDLRLRADIDPQSRKQVAVDAMNPDGGGKLTLGDNKGQQIAWMNLVAGLLGGPGNAGVHEPGERTETYAMGIVGAVSLILAALDEKYGEPA